MPAPITKPGAILLAVVQGAFWLLTGLWPFVHLPSFLWVTGPKKDIWLLYTVSVLITAIGGTLLAAGIRKQVTSEIKGLAIAGAAGLTGIDVYYALNDVIWDVYLLDAVAETVLLTLWLWAGTKDLGR
ncbi:hypothetical protein POKO110462_17890 [Pontibacter korlensis]|uniref:Uncharacterized protein n=1 Tax=Pontibacter korlensis TaxID=400092 RepID=A0A0E3ZI03_9BACT|nr:hypothetical protein [Pontibacter korlensis]AKD05065.1 hypothetical protein PKOR_20795 [Pontibacter korlensis]